MTITKKEFISKYNGKQFIRHIDNHQSKEVVYEKAKQALAENNLSLDGLTFDNVSGNYKYNQIIGHNYTFFVDKREQDAIVTISFRSKGYIAFDGKKNSYGDIPSVENFTDDSFFINGIDGIITYKVVQ